MPVVMILKRPAFMLRATNFINQSKMLFKSQEAKMKKASILMVMVVVVLGLSMLFYTMPVEVKATGPQAWWNRIGSGFELTSVQTTLPASVQKEAWDRYGGGFELTSVRTAPPISGQKVAWDRYGGGFELTSVRTAAEIKASIQKYMWNQAGSGFELTSVPNALSTSDQ
jgi:hypothetical protein